MSDEQLGRGYAGTSRRHRSPNLPLTVLLTIYVVALVGGVVLYVVAFVTLNSDPRSAAGVFAWASGLTGLGVLGAMLHLAVAAIRRVVEENAG